MSMQLLSNAFEDGDAIPSRFTCDGDDVAPELCWTDLPEGTVSLALIVDDPDAPDPAAPKMVWDHWILYNLPPELATLPEATTSDQLPEAVLDGINSWGREGYGGPCPPVGRHRYFFRIYALDATLPKLAEPTKDHLLLAMDQHILAHAELVGTYQR